MARRKADPVTWVINQSLSSWTWFGAEAPVSLVLPAGMTGTQLALVGTEAGADGNADPAQAQDILDITGAKVLIAIPAAGGRVVFLPDTLRAQGWIALRSENAVNVAQNQAAARAATWLRVTD